MHKYTGRTTGGTLLTVTTEKPMKRSELRFIFNWHKEEVEPPKQPHRGKKEGNEE